MNFNNFVTKVLELMDKTNSNIVIKFTPQKGYIIDILVSVDDDVIIDTSINTQPCLGTEENKMAKIIRAISEYC